MATRAADDFAVIAQRTRQLRHVPHEYVATSIDDYCVGCGRSRGYNCVEDRRWCEGRGDK